MSIWLQVLRKSILRVKYKPLTVSLLVVILGFGTTYQLWAFFQAQARNELTRVFLLEADIAVDRFLRHLNEFDQQLEAIRALFAASVVVDRDEFTSFVETLRLQKSNPGVRAVGYADYLSVINQAPLTYIFPETPENIALIGKNTFESPPRERAMLNAMATGQAGLSEPLQLFQQSGEVNQPSYVFFMPIFRSLENKYETRQLAMGWAYIAFNMQESVTPTLISEQVNLTYEIFDITDQTSPFQIYGVSGVSKPGMANGQYLQEAFRTVEAYGRLWTIKTSPTTEFENRYYPKTHWWVALFGATATIFLSLLCWLLADRTQALRQIKRINRQLSLSEQRWKFALEGSGDGMWDYDIQNQTNYVSDQWKELLGYTAGEISTSIEEWKNRIHPDDYERVTQTLENYLNGRIGYYKIEHRLKCKSGEWKWFLTRGIVVDQDDKGNPKRMVGTLTDISHMKASEELIWHQANFDALTNLPNRRMFFDRLEHEIRRTNRYGNGFALAFIDLDEFKEINDVYGHQAGDEALKIISKRLKNVVRATDVVARLGGDEFTVILGNSTNQTDVDIVVRKILDALVKPIVLGSGTVSVSASIGIALCPAHATTSDDLLNKADRAMYKAKEAGKNEWRYYQ